LVVLESLAVLTAALVGAVVGVELVLVLAQVELAQVELEALLLYLPQP
jgi:hypothetical protein